MDIQDQLNQINTAISAIENGAQLYTINNRKFERADIGKLYDERRNLQAQINAEQNNGFGMRTYIARFDRR